MDKMDILTHTASEAAFLLLLVDVTKLLRQIIRAQEGLEKGKKKSMPSKCRKYNLCNPFKGFFFLTFYHVFVFIAIMFST